MLDRRWTQSAGVAGILFVVLVLIASLISGDPANSTDSTEKMVSYIAGNRNGLLIAAALGGVASVIILLFIGVVSYLLRRGDERSPTGYLVLAGGTAAVAVSFLQGIPIAGLALVADQKGGLDNSSATRVLYEFSNQVSPTSFLVAAFLAALGIGIVRQPFTAQWLGWLSVAVALLNLVAGIVSVTATSAVALVIALLGLIGFGIVVLITSFYLLRYQPAAVA